MTAGKFITLEGGEGSGKSTQVAALAAALRGDGREVIETREPGGSPGAEAIRELLIHGESARWDAKSETLLHFAARRDHLRTTVWPALERGVWVISDRFADSTMAYQGYGHRLDPDRLIRLYALTAGDFFPDLTLIIDLPVEEGLKRAQARGGADRYERMGRDFHERIRNGFREIAERDPERCFLIDGSGDADTVAAAIANAVADQFNLELP